MDESIDVKPCGLVLASMEDTLEWLRGESGEYGKLILDSPRLMEESGDAAGLEVATVDMSRGVAMLLGSSSSRDCKDTIGIWPCFDGIKPGAAGSLEDAFVSKPGGGATGPGA